MSARIVTCPYKTGIDNILEENITSTLWRTSQSIVSQDAVVEVETGKKITYGELTTTADLIGRRLLSHGCQRNDIIYLLSPNSIDLLVAVFASLRIGAVPAIANHQLTLGELEHQLRICNASYLFTTANLLTLTNRAIKTVPVKKVFTMGPNDDAEAFDIVSQLLSSVQNLKPLPPFDVINEQFEDGAVILFSSGTTGLQKAVLLSHRNFQSVYSAVRYPEVGLLDYSLQHPQLVFTPLAHVTGLMLAILLLVNGSHVLLMNKFELKTFLSVIDDHRLVNTLVVPPVATMMVKNAESANYRLDSLEDIVVGAAPLGAELEAQLIERCEKLTRVRQAYGLTETSGGICFVPRLLQSSGEITKDKFGSIGVPVAGTQIKVIDIKTGELLGPHKNGEVCIKSPLNMLRYINNPEATKATIRDGWLYSGDIGYYDDDGYFYIVDRLKELIKYKAHQVPPAELESVLLSHNEVEDAAVVGLPDERAGELPLAWVVRKPSATVTESQLQNFVSERVSPYMRLRGGVHFVASIPKTASGKILRRDIKAALLKNKL